MINVESIQRLPPAIQEQRFANMIENDAATTSNYQRLASNALERAFRKQDREKSLGDFQDETLGEIQAAMRRLFPDLTLNSLGNPLSDRGLLSIREQVAIFSIKISREEKRPLLIYFLIFSSKE